MIVFGCGLAALAFTWHVLCASVIVALLGIAAGCLNPLLVSWLQRQADEQMRGRVLSVAMLGAVGLTPVSYALAGVLVAYSVTVVFLAAR